MAWLDPTLGGNVREMANSLLEPDRSLFLRWAAGEALTKAETDRVTFALLPTLRAISGQYGSQPRYRWVDNKTGETDGEGA